MLHEIKLREDFIEPILKGEKTFEVRINDRGYQKGDLIKFKSITRSGLPCRHKIDNRTYEITYVLSGYGIQEGYVVFGIKEKK